MNKKVIRFESRRAPNIRRRKINKIMFCKLESLFFLAVIFFITPFPLHFKDDF
jgi:hypothetical protein